MIHAPLCSTARFVGVWLLVWIAALGCDAAANRRPEVTLLADPAAALVLGAIDFDQYANRIGTRVAIETLAPEALSIRAQVPAGADVVVVADRACWDQLGEQRRIDPPPWRFAFRRERVVLAVAAPPARLDTATTDAQTRDALIESAASIAMVDPLIDQGGRMAKLALQRAGWWERCKPKIQIVESLGRAAERVQTGRAEAILLRRSVLERRFSAKLYAVCVLDPYPEAPDVLSGAILSGSDDPRAARQLWNFLERRIRQSKYDYLENCKLQMNTQQTTSNKRHTSSLKP